MNRILKLRNGLLFLTHNQALYVYDELWTGVKM